MTLGRRPRSAVVIINPLSGHGRHQAQIDAHTALAHEILTAHGFSVTIRPTTAAGDARAFAQEAVAADCELVVAWGGDGTINETASALIHTDVPMGIVPAGSGNGLASDLLVPFDPRTALHLAATGRTMAIDAGTVDDCLFFNIAGVGIDAVIAARFNTRGLQQRGLAAYLQLSAAELLRYRCQTYEIAIEQERVEQRALLVAFANGRQYGNRLLIAPGARLDDGLLEVVVVEQLSLTAIAWRLPALFRGTLRTGRGVSMRAAREVRIRTSGPIPYHVDGEPRLGGEQLHVRAIPAALLVRVAGV
jgi:YegS/Rv2252/BmrU family lipid kinase